MEIIRSLIILTIIFIYQNQGYAVGSNNKLLKKIDQLPKVVKLKTNNYGRVSLTNITQDNYKSNLQFSNLRVNDVIKIKTLLLNIQQNSVVKVNQVKTLQTIQIAMTNKNTYEEIQLKIKEVSNLNLTNYEVDQFSMNLSKDIILTKNGYYSALVTLDLNNLKRFQRESQVIDFYLAMISLKNKNFIDYQIKIIRSLSQATKPEDQKFILANIIDHLEHIPIDFAPLLLTSIKNTQYTLDEKNNDHFYYYISRYDFENKLFNEFIQNVEHIHRNSAYYLPSQILKATYFYRIDRIDQAIFTLEKVLSDPEFDKSDWNRNVSALTLARIYFQKSEYKKSYDAYLQIDSNHPLWIQAMTEQAWAQIQYKDYEGAAGNMFSLHTDYFKNIYNPESYLIRIVGYLNLCQYGDSLQTIENLKKKYSIIQEKLTQFNDIKSNSKYYDTYKAVFQKTQNEEVLPKSFFFEIVKNPEFIQLQKQINEIEDEKNLMSMINDKSKKEISEIELLLNKSNKEQIRNSINKQRNKIVYQELLDKKIDIINSHFNFEIDYQKKQIEFINKMNSILKISMMQQTQRLKSILEMVDVLNYEVFSGASEQMRFQLAGGQIKDHDHKKELTANKEKSMNWKFKGEIWEDEVGHYRSSLKNLCQNI